MNPMNISDLVKALMTIILLSIAIGKFESVKEFALKEGIKAITMHGYKPTRFFKER